MAYNQNQWQWIIILIVLENPALTRKKLLNEQWCEFNLIFRGPHFLVFILIN